ncbi:NADH/Ubiquinone/plastoquinone (Complex I) [uncultured delta proteobacterium]|uniref:NADH/Ubiquinone/plastoquinone (Complex I) n=1 Tax=uncultured delta proteobacterium TaxID=34034 RepID=A0A212KHS3_9DELT|nr:NADH/Ubiquinone/plastoquinone (Complex I) [uncultured delta proteobacterium]
MLFALFLLPLAAGCISFFITDDWPRRCLLVGTALIHCILSALCWITAPEPFRDILALDAAGRLILGLTSLLFLAASVYAVGYFEREGEHPHMEYRRHLQFTNAPEAVFTACLLLFLASTSLVAISHHLGVLWVGIEATTLATAPLIYFHRHKRSLEATWKYLIICSVGIALALLGNFLLDVAWQQEGKPLVDMTMTAMLQTSQGISAPWFKAAFIFIFIGYGTKMGIAPMHTWLPDAHSEAPALVSCLLSGALLNGAFLGIFRVQQLAIAAGFADFSRDIFIVFGLLSMGLAAMFIVNQGDFKRMLAYSSVEHMGIILLGCGIGGMAAGGGMLHTMFHSLTKATLFLLSGNILAAYHTKSCHDVSGLIKVMPGTGVLWTAAFLAIVGTPPFGVFTSEFTVLRGLMQEGYIAVALLYLLFLGIIFVGMATACLHMIQGQPPRDMATATDGPHPGMVRESFPTLLPPAFLLTASLFLGLYRPAWVDTLIANAASLVGGVLPL